MRCNSFPERVDLMKNVTEQSAEATARFERRARENQARLTSNLLQRYDYIVCGSGSSGSAVAGRLAADPSVNVLLVESGGSDDTPTVMDPNRWITALGSELDWGFAAAPSSLLNGRAIPYSMGRVLGGGSSVNVCTWSRGHRSDWDYYASEAGDRAWSHESVLAVYRRIEDWQGAPNNRYRGVGGPVYVRPAQSPHPFFAAMLEGAASCGLPKFEDPNGRMMESEGGSAFVDEIVHGDRRQSIFRSYVYPLMDRPNLTVLTGALVTRVHVEGRRTRGVNVLHDGKLLRIDAALEVVLSLGAIQTPKVLMHSGIGDPAELTKLDIPLVQSLPGVGRNLHDHISLGSVWEGTGVDMPTALRGQTVTFWKSRGDLDAPNLFTYAIPAPFLTPENALRFLVPKQAWSFAIGMRPQSRGTVTLAGRNPSDPPRIDAGYLRNPQDLEDILKGLAACREIARSAVLRPFTRGDSIPGEGSRSELERYVRDGLVTFWHQSGTARMGRDDASVVDGRLKVHGVDGLRIADASILPRVTTGNTMAPCVVIGEQAAMFLREEREG
jgi:choline dehydrogenase